MTRPFDIDQEMVRQVMSDQPELNSTQVAAIISGLIDKPVKPATIRAIKRRHPEWLIPTSNGGGSTSGFDYECARALGVKPIHKNGRWHDWIMLTSYERAEAGILAKSKPSAKNAAGYVARKLRLGLVVDYHPSCGFFERIALPWERDAGSYLRMPAPEYARLEVQVALEDKGVPQEVRDFWQRWLDNDLVLMGKLPVQGEG